MVNNISVIHILWTLYNDILPLIAVPLFVVCCIACLNIASRSVTAEISFTGGTCLGVQKNGQCELTKHEARAAAFVPGVRECC
jgi:hypothetical protein